MEKPVLSYSKKRGDSNNANTAIDLEKWILSLPNDKLCDPSNVLVAADLIIEHRELELSFEGKIYYGFTKDGIIIAILNTAELFKNSYHIELIQ